jgi:hypothetical protein
MYSVLYQNGTAPFLFFEFPFILKKSGAIAIQIYVYRTNTLGAYLMTPAMGSHFVMYLAKMQGFLFSIISCFFLLLITYYILFFAQDV